MLHEYFQFNKNILISFVVSIIFSAIIAQGLENQENYLNTTYTLIFDYIFYFSTFGMLYYLTNRKKYLLDSGKINRKKLRNDLLKIITSLGIAETIYTISRWILQYYFLSLDYEPYLASLISQGISTIIYMIVVNLSAKMTKLFKHGN